MKFDWDILDFTNPNTNRMPKVLNSFCHRTIESILLKWTGNKKNDYEFRNN